jgi:hypothetical protein
MSQRPHDGSGPEQTRNYLLMSVVVLPMGRNYDKRDVS